MDNKFSGTQMGIGWSSNLAQLAMTYYWTELTKDNPDKDKIKELNRKNENTIFNGRVLS